MEKEEELAALFRIQTKEVKLDKKPLGFWAVQKDRLSQVFRVNEEDTLCSFVVSAYWFKRLGGTELDGKLLWNLVRGFDSAFIFFKHTPPPVNALVNTPT